MDIGKSLTYIMEDDRWMEKLAIGTGVIIVSSMLSVVLIGFLGFFIVMGYCLRLVANVRDGLAQPLPEWNEWGEDLTRGLKLVVALFVWALPIVLMVIPMTVGAAMTGSSSGEFIGTLIIFCGTCLTMIYGLALVVMTPGITISFLRDDRINSGLMVGDIWSWTQINIGPVIIVALVIIAASFVISMVASVAGLLLCLVGLIVTVPLGALVTYLFQYHLIGQLAREHPMYPVGRAFEPRGASADAADQPTQAENDQSQADQEAATDDAETSPVEPDAMVDELVDEEAETDVDIEPTESTPDLSLDDSGADETDTQDKNPAG